MNTTKEGIVVEKGQKWRDLDKRMNGRTVVIRSVVHEYAYYNAYPKGRLAIRRMHRPLWELVK